MIQQRIPLQIFEVPSGTAVFDWTVPKEWNIRDAYIKDSSGRRVVDFQKCNLHVLNYSVPIHATMPLSEIRPHLFTIPAHPDWIPYRTSYYKEDWGFCLSHNQLVALPDGEYEVRIDSTLADGSLSYGECSCRAIQRRDSDLLPCLSSFACERQSLWPNSCHALAKFLAERRSDLRYSYRFLFIPGTIGAITWLARNRDGMQRVSVTAWC